MKSVVRYYWCLLPVLLLIACKKKTQEAYLTTVPENRGYQLQWSDDFSGSGLDAAKWYHRYPGVRHDGFNDSNAISVSNGNLFIKVYSDTIGGIVKHHTGMIATKKEFLYGKFEVKAAFVNQSGSWSAFWLQSATMGNPVGNPQQAGMEIDVVETLPNDGRVYQNLHWDGYTSDHKTAGIKTADLGANSGSYHVYTLEWSPEFYKFYVDGQQTWAYSTYISQRSEFIILSSEVRNAAAGSWAGPIPQGGYGSKEHSHTMMKVDYVKYYKAL
ncbi:glycoside hydrolase family 16 protein [Niabella hirudinis]|uniref:glycoside hydrolase family 16 protein n=1 Tax=Niabella hirudinis TaxID=1285929 RepID=UPI003EB8B525